MLVCTGADKSLVGSGRKQANVSVRMAWISFGALPCRKERKNLMAACISLLLKPRASLTRFRDCFLPGRAKDLPAPRQVSVYLNSFVKLQIFNFGHLSSRHFYIYVRTDVSFRGYFRNKEGSANQKFGRPYVNPLKLSGYIMYLRD